MGAEPRSALGISIVGDNRNQQSKSGARLGWDLGHEMYLKWRRILMVS
jgi:hypothetical protein